MDLPAILRRAPELCLIDELAHTNAPGIEHAKRYEDVEEVLAAGHRRPLDAQRPAPRVAQRPDHRAERRSACARRSPTRSSARADEVVLIDLTPEALLERLRAGKVYPPERIDAALNNFFRIENLAALREVALRQVAEEVGRQAPDHRARRLARGEPRRRRAAGRRRAPARARRALPGRAAARAPRLALGPAPRRRPRSAVGAPARAEPSPTRTRALAGGAAPARLGARARGCSRRNPTTSRRAIAEVARRRGTHLHPDRPLAPGARPRRACACRCRSG